MDYEAAVAWLSRLEGSDVGVLIGSPNRYELPQAVLHGRLKRDAEGELVAGIASLGAEEAASFSVGDKQRAGFTVVRALVRDVAETGDSRETLKIEQEGVAITVWPEPDWDKA